MPITIVDRGARNRVVIPAEVREDGDAQVAFDGDDNELILAAGCRLAGARFTLGTGCRFEAGADCRLAALDVFAKDRGSISIGPGTVFTFRTKLYAHEPGAIRIGSGCLVASGTFFTLSDMHPIFDLRTGARLNPARDIVVEDRVWVGYEAVLLKGAAVGRGSVVGLRAVVTGPVEPDCVVAGAPARVVRREVRWEP
jgi:acetyltransferase-like isoleucine patch superfamily enzyme